MSFDANYSCDLARLEISQRWFQSISEALSKPAAVHFHVPLWRELVVEGIDLVQTAWPGSDLVDWVVQSLEESIGIKASISTIENACRHVAAQLDVEIIGMSERGDLSSYEMWRFVEILNDPEKFESAIEDLTDQVEEEKWN